MDSYNGYSGAERDKKYQEYKRLRDLRQSVPAVPSCQLCGNDDSKLIVEPHSEDYSLPYRWTPPYEYMVCRRCHGWIHKRFNQPDNWDDFKSHVRRGGYAWEFTTKEVGYERKEAASARTRGIRYEWKKIQGRREVSKDSWWEKLSMSMDSLTASWARPRP